MASHLEAMFRAIREQQDSDEERAAADRAWLARLDRAGVVIRHGINVAEEFLHAALPATATEAQLGLYLRRRRADARIIGTWATISLRGEASRRDNLPLLPRSALATPGSAGRIDFDFEFFYYPHNTPLLEELQLRDVRCAIPTGLNLDQPEAAIEIDVAWAERAADDVRYGLGEALTAAMIPALNRDLAATLHSVGYVPPPTWVTLAT